MLLDWFHAAYSIIFTHGIIFNLVRAFIVRSLPLTHSFASHTKKGQKSKNDYWFNYTIRVPRMYRFTYIQRERENEQAEEKWGSRRREKQTLSGSIAEQLNYECFFFSARVFCVCCCEWACQKERKKHNTQKMWLMLVRFRWILVPIWFCIGYFIMSDFFYFSKRCCNLH